ncbi:MAG: PAS domain S-box protein [Peptococcaceae bacterium]|nr:PAS domain S-box protein [Peptococcaceae bacterium]
MNNDIFSSLISNVALLIALGAIYEISYFTPSKYRNAVNGIIIGVIGIAIMSIPFRLSPGIIFDTRTILLSIAGLFFGPIPTLIALFLTSIFRIFLGGVGIWTGVLTLFISAFIGLAAHRYITLEHIKNKWFKLYLFGMVTSLAMLACMLTLPWPISISVLEKITLPVILIYPFGTVFLSLLLIHQIERNTGIILLQEANNKYKSIFYNNKAVMLLIDPQDGRIVDANNAASTYYGWSVDTLKTMNISEINTSPPEKIKIAMAESVSLQKNYFVFKHRNSADQINDVEVYSGPLIVSGKTLLYTIAHDISERVAIEKALQESELRFRMLVEGSPDAIFIQTDSKFSFLNKTALAFYGATSEEQLIGTSVMDRFKPEYHQKIAERINTVNINKKPVPAFEEIHLTLDGTEVVVEVTAVPINYDNKDGAMVFARDISERKKIEKEKSIIEAQLRQQQKLEAIGTLAGGIAHEINNPINGIMNYAQLMLDTEQINQVNSEYAKEIIHETKRISEIIKNLLQFSRLDKQTHSLACIDDILNQTLSLIRSLIKKDRITLDIDISENLPEFKCRSQQIQQVIMNLLTNARDALNEKYPEYHENKIIYLAASLKIIDGRRYIRITVKDYGIGIDPQIKDKIFEPFFSTKPREKGTGLGLSISFGIVEEHHGKLSIGADEEGYTCFCLDLPVDNGWSTTTRSLQ